MGQKVYYIVNPSGAVHTVSREHAKKRLKQIGWRMATEDEVEAYNEHGTQVHDAPIAEPWNPEPEPEPVLEAGEET